MDTVKVLAVLLVFSLSLNAYFIVTGEGDTLPGKISRSLTYAYHQAFPPLGNETEMSTGADNGSPGMTLPVAVGTESSESPGTVQDVDTDNLTLQDILLLMEKNTSIDEEVLLTLLSRTNETVLEGEESEGEGEAIPPPEGVTWKVYNSTKWHFSVPYPPNWTIHEGTSTNPVVTFTAPVETSCSAVTSECYQYVASLSVGIDLHPGTLVFEDYFNRKVASLQKDLGITATSKTAQTTISGNKAYWIEYYTRDSRGNPSKMFMQYFTLLDKKVWVITYTGPYSTRENVYSRNKPDAQRMIEGIVIEREYKVV
ncbi:MAG: hypothetical protein NQU46_04780 [Methanolinea sp.]|nr:hypothetical protein [Methanolinea sp.]